METTVPPSFIPHDTPQAARVRQASTRGLLDLFTLIGIVLFVTSGALGVGVFLYNQYLETSSASKLDQLERARAAFEPALIQELTRLDDRMSVGSEIIGRHLAFSAFFRMLEQTTIQTISFESLEYEALDPARISIAMEGIADSVNAIALQADVFTRVGMITSPIFSDINREEGGVRFQLTALLNASTLNFAALVRGATQSAAQGSVQQNTAIQPTPSLPGESGGTPSPFDPPSEGSSNQ